MSNEPKNSRLAVVPSILMGTAAVLAAASTLYVNLRDDTPSAPAAAATMPVDTPAPLATSPAPAAARKVRLRLDRVQVDDDGSMGDTDWTFQVSLDGEPAFSVSMPALSDKPGQNLVRPSEDQDASVEVELPAGKNAALAVTGWKKGFLGSGRGEVNGSDWLASGFDKSAVTLKSDKAKGPQFVLYFSAKPVE